MGTHVANELMVVVTAAQTLATDPELSVKERDRIDEAIKALLPMLVEEMQDMRENHPDIEEWEPG
jgi:hypothetical protein